MHTLILLEIAAAAYLIISASGNAPQEGGTSSTSCPGNAAATCTAVRPFRHDPEVIVRLEETPGGKPLELRVFLSVGGREVELPRFFGSVHWPFCAVPTDGHDRADGSAVVAGDLAGRGGEDLAVVGECTTGIGPTGSEPFRAGAIYVAGGGMQFHADEAASERFTGLLQARCKGELHACDLAALARSAAGPSTAR